MGPNLPKKVFTFEKKKKSEHHQWIKHSQISLSTKFHFKQAILNFKTKFAQKGYFQWKTEKVNITIDFCIFELVLIPNFSLTWKCWFVEPNLPQKYIYGQKKKKKKWISLLNSKITVIMLWDFDVSPNFPFTTSKTKETLRIVTIAMICTTLASHFNIGGICKTQSDIYDGVFNPKIVGCSAYSQKSSILDARLGSTYTSAFRKDSLNV